MPLMTPLQIVGLWAALNAIITLALAINCAVTRGKTKILIGDGGNEAMLRAIRAHGNNVEYTPLVLVMLVTLGLLQASTLILHLVGGLLFAGRAAHGLGLSTNSGVSVGRAGGTLLTIVAAVIAIVTLLIKAFG